VAQVSAFTDWLLAIRYLYEFSDESFTLGAFLKHGLGAI